MLLVVHVPCLFVLAVVVVVVVLVFVVVVVVVVDEDVYWYCQCNRPCPRSCPCYPPLFVVCRPLSVVWYWLCDDWCVCRDC